MENSESSLEKFTDSLETILTGIPAPVRKSFFKALGQLCTAAIEIPVSMLESKANEIRASTVARMQIIKRGGDLISEKISVPDEYVVKASSKYAAKIIKEQINLDDITRYAANDLSFNSKKINDSNCDSDISDDWLNEFENLAKLKSSEDMKMIFGRILSGEIINPGSFSIRTIRLISQLDNDAAKLFQLLCNLSVSINIGSNIADARVISFIGSAGANSLKDYGLSYPNLNILQEYGLIISDYNSVAHYDFCIVNEQNKANATFCFQKKQYVLMPKDRSKYNKELHLNGVALTKAGKELLQIIPFLDVTEYKDKLNDFFKSKDLEMHDLKK